MRVTSRPITGRVCILVRILLVRHFAVRKLPIPNYLVPVVCLKTTGHCRTPQDTPQDTAGHRRTPQDTQWQFPLRHEEVLPEGYASDIAFCNRH